MASDRDLIHFFEGLKCGHFPKRCNGNHDPLVGTEAYRARIWPWDFARRLAWGIMRLMKRHYWNHHRHERAFTTMDPQCSRGVSDTSVVIRSRHFNYPSIPKDEIKCTACRHNRRRNILLTPAFAVSADILTTLAWTTAVRLANAICPMDTEIILTTPMVHSTAEEPFVKKEAIKLHVCENLEFISNHLNMKETMNVVFVLLNFQTVKVIQATRIMMMSL